MSQSTPGPTGNGPTGSIPDRAGGAAESTTASPGPYPGYEVLPAGNAVPVVETADQIAALVLAVPGVAQLHAGRFGEVATYLPGRRVTGVKLSDDRVEVHVVVRFGEPLRAVAAHIHAVVAAVVTVPVQVFIEDLTAAHAA